VKALGGARFAPVESWFVKANDRAGERAVWLKWTIFAPPRAAERAIAEAWAVAFRRAGPNVAVKASVPLAQARFAKDRLDVAVADARLDAACAHGEVVSGVHRIAFDLSFEVRGGPFLHWPRPWMYERSFPSYKATSPLADARASGSLSVEGEHWNVSSWPAMLGHNWGPRHSDLYAWSHCNAWDDADDLVIEGFTGRARVGPLRTPLATVVLARWRGQAYPMNEPRDVLRNRGEITPRRWKVRARGAGAALEGEVWAEADELVGLHYANPDAPVTYCLNTKLARARFELMTSAGSIVAHSRVAALEIGTHDARHGVRMYL
jgi:hypothetical protein